MRVQINKAHGSRNDLLVTLSKEEIDDVLFQIANRGRLMQLPGLLRHESKQDSDERRRVDECKIPVEEHIKQLSIAGHDLLNSDGRPKRPVIVIGSRNTGNNHGFIAWQNDHEPSLFHIRAEPFLHPVHSCLIKYQTGQLAVRNLEFKDRRVFDGTMDVTGEITWAVYANWVLKDGEAVNIEKIIDQFYDVRHIFAFHRESADGKQVEGEVYAGYPERFRENLLKLWRKGTPRNRFLHNCLGFSEDTVFILQREGTIEEVTQWLREAGAIDAIILDNGASTFCWTWWLQAGAGGFLFTAPDFRPNSSAIIAIVLKGPVEADLPSGSVGATII